MNARDRARIYQFLRTETARARGGFRKLTCDGKDDGGEVEPSDVRRETSCSTKVGEELSSRDVGKQHVDVDGVLIGLVA